ncbi:MAG TPA: methyltransferase domain-containing protein, partial [Bacteroidetes bacterium]|nr:methyltransferase domain-containing protein [Bacteroidota bacterium]
MLKEKIYKIPVIGPLAIKIYRRLTGKKDFTTSNKYWEDRYKAGGNSGTGSYNELASFKGEIINEFVSQNNVESVIEFGCGDGNQLKYFKFKSYTGFDISPTIIESCIKLYKSDPSKQFRLMDTPVEHKVDLTMSLDVIYHLV